MRLCTEQGRPDLAAWHAAKADDSPEARKTLAMRPRRLRILFMGDGGSPHTQRFVSYFAEIGHLVFLLSQEPVDLPGVTVISPDAPPGVVDFQAWMPVCHEAIRRVKPDLVHGHYASIQGLWAALSGFHPFALTLWGSDINVDPYLAHHYKALVRFALAQADLLTGDSTDLNAAALELAGFPIAAPELIRFGVDTAVFKPGLDASELRRRFAIGAGPVVFSPRQFKRAANIHRILEAAPLVLARHPGTVFVLKTFATPRDDYRLSLEAQAEDLGITVSVRFVDGGSHDEMPLWYATAATTLSLRDFDAGSVSVMESMACCTPVIASAIPSNLELMGDDGGALIDPQDVNALAGAILAVLDNPTLAAEVGLRGRKRTIAMSDYRVNMARVEALYAGLFRAWPPPPAPQPEPETVQEIQRQAIAIFQGGWTALAYKVLEQAIPLCVDTWEQAGLLITADLIGHPLAGAEPGTTALSAIVTGVRNPR